MLGIFGQIKQPSKEEKARQERIAKAAQEGLPNVVEHTLNRGAFMEQIKKDREKINKDYANQVRKFHQEKRKEKSDLLQKYLPKQQKKIEVNRYHLEKRAKAGDPRLEYYQKLSDKRYGLIEKHQLKNFKDSKRIAREQLRKQRKVQLKQASTQLQEQVKSSALDNLKNAHFGQDGRSTGMGPAATNKAVPKYQSPREQFMAAREAGRS